MKFQDIETALRSAFVSGGFFASANIAAENSSYKPTSGIPWAQMYIRPNTPAVSSLGDDGYDEHTGFFQINLNYPTGQGTKAANEKADAIAALFKAGCRPSYNGQEVIIRSCGISGGRLVNGWFQIVITINWNAFVAR